MKIGGSFFRSKVAQRFFLLFVICTILPIIALSILSYSQVSNQLKQNSLKRLQNSVKAHGMSIYERMLLLETNMQLILSTVIKDGNDFSNKNHINNFNEQLLKHFNALAFISQTGDIQQIYGGLKKLPEDFVGKALIIEGNKTSIFFEHGNEDNRPSQIYMLMKASPGKQNSNILVGEIKQAYLWGIGFENVLPPHTDLCIVDQVRTVLVSSFKPDRDILHKIMIGEDEDNSRVFEHRQGDGTYLFSYWSLFLKSRFHAPVINVILRSDSVYALAPLAKFKKTFPFVILLFFWIILLLSIFHIRKSLIPLEKLKEGTLRVANKDLDTPVIVTSNDEFEELADAFNSMSRKLSRHFDALSTRANINRTILSSLNTKQIINTALNKMFTFFDCDSISVNLAVEKQPGTFRSYMRRNIKIRKPEEEFFHISDRDEKILARDPQYIAVYTKYENPGFLSKADCRTQNSFIVLPLFYAGVLKGTIAIGHSERKSYIDDDLRHARQMADQVMIALSNSSLVEELEKLNIGTLEALARTVDAKSAWTAGHSERVASLSIKIAEIIGYTQKEIEVLQRAAYLHDIGKIGISLSILDKPDKLTDKEFDKIKDHPTIGARILEPINAYEDVIPIVLQHHEKFNGKGYPSGLSGEDISLGARILAVADVYDAVVSDRPYRDGWIEDKAIEMIKSEAGKYFDPKVVDAFLAAI